MNRDYDHGLDVLGEGAPEVFGFFQMLIPLAMEGIKAGIGAISDAFTSKQRAAAEADRKAAAQAATLNAQESQKKIEARDAAQMQALAPGLRALSAAQKQQAAAQGNLGAVSQYMANQQAQAVQQQAFAEKQKADEEHAAKMKKVYIGVGVAVAGFGGWYAYKKLKKG